jgi:hypothetical protein
MATKMTAARATMVHQVKPQADGIYRFKTKQPEENRKEEPRLLFKDHFTCQSQKREVIEWMLEQHKWSTEQHNLSISICGQGID